VDLYFEPIFPQVDIVSDCFDDAKHLLDLQDNKPMDSYPDELLIDMFNLAKKCTNRRKDKQPYMREVLEFIKDIEKKKVGKS
jgi:hypothetical protein